MEKESDDIFNDIFSILEGKEVEINPEESKQEVETPSGMNKMEIETDNIIEKVVIERTKDKKVRTVDEILKDKKIEKAKLFYAEFENKDLGYTSNAITKVDIAINGTIITEQHKKGEKTERDIYQDIINKVMKINIDEAYSVVVVSSSNLTITRFILASLSRKGIKITTRTKDINELINTTINKFRALKSDEGNTLIEAYNIYCESINKAEVNFKNNKTIFEQYESHIAHKNDKVYNDILKNFISGS